MASKTDGLIRTRTTLIQRLKDWQDQASWQDFFDTYGRLIYNVAIKGGLSEAEAQDVVQETMISVAKHMPTFKYDRRAGSFKAWLLNLTRWRMADQIRKRGRIRGFPAFAPDAIVEACEVADPMSFGLDTFWDIEWERNLLEAALTRVKRRLDPEKYQIFDFYVNKDWAAPQVAKTFGISVDQVYLAKHRVTEMLKEEVKRLQAPD